MTEPKPGRISTFDVVLALIALGVATFLIFQNLSAPAIRQWDEAIYANNALDMYKTGDPVVLRRNGEVTFYNTKPPLVIWLQVLSMHIFGVSEFAIRFPSALVGVFTCLAILVFTARTLKNIRIGIVATLIIATTYGLVRQHVFKTGDLDAVLVFWITAYTLLFFHFLIEQPKQHNSLFTLIGFCVTAAFLSKGIAGLMPLPGLLCCAFLMKRGRWLFNQKHIWLTAFAVFSVCLGYYVLREILAGGYLYKTWHSEYTRFFVNVMTWHNHPWYYYFWNWQRLDFFTPYVYVLPVAIILGLLSKSHRNITILFAVQVLVYIGILSYPIVKLMWYDAPVYPLLGLICAIGGVVVWDFVRDKTGLNASTEKVLFTILLCAIFFVPIRDMYLRNAELRLPVDILEHEGFFIRELNRSLPDMKSYKVLMLADQNAHYTQVDFYINAYNRHKSYQIELLRDTSLVLLGDTVACCQEKQIAWLREKYHSEEIFVGEAGCVLVKVNRKGNL